MTHPELEAKSAELTARLEGEREVWSRLRVMRETVAQVLSELPGQDVAQTASLREPVAAEEPVKPEVRVVGAVTVPHWREGFTTDVLPDAYRDIVEVIADAPGPMHAKQIAPRTGLPAVTAKIEGTRGKLKRLVEHGWLIEDQPGRFAPAHPAPGGESAN